MCTPTYERVPVSLLVCVYTNLQMSTNAFTGKCVHQPMYCMATESIVALNSTADETNTSKH